VLSSSNLLHRRLDHRPDEVSELVAFMLSHVRWVGLGTHVSPD
jgi:hypothetical protein